MNIETLDAILRKLMQNCYIAVDEELEEATDDHVGMYCMGIAHFYRAIKEELEKE